MDSLNRLLLLAVLVAVSACASLPSGPGVAALPGSGKTLEQFQLDDTECQRYASAQAARPPAAGVPAATYEVQRRYDFAYIQCMYSRGHKVPVSGGYTNAPTGSIPPPNEPPPVPDR
jgi:hypothetical protein